MAFIHYSFLSLITMYQVIKMSECLNEISASALWALTLMFFILSMIISQQRE